MRKLVGLCALAVVAALVATPAFAAVQNVKVSGDIDVKAISRDNFDLRKTTRFTTTNDDKLQAFLQTTRLQVAADLTDNVSATVGLSNQRLWDADVEATNNIDLDLAYVTLKELIYSPLTVTVGRQNLKFGTGFIVGPGFLGNPNGTFSTAGNATLTNVHGSQLREFSITNAYDAIRATLDFAPLTVDVIGSKINEVGEGGHDQDLWGLNLNWKGAPVDRWKGEWEGYVFYKNDRSATVTLHDNAGRTYEHNQLATVGTRAAVEPIKSLWVNAEVAGQFGRLEDTVLLPGQASGNRARAAMAAQGSVNYTFTDVKYTPNLGAGAVYFSGQKANAGSNSIVHAWDQMYRGSFTTAIQDFLAGTDQAGGLYTTFDPSDTSAATNRYLFYVDVGVKPLQDLSLQGRYTHALFAEAPVSGRSKNAGDEVDLQAKWDYTEDVQFGLIGAAFFPGAYYDKAPAATQSNNTAWEVVGDLAVKF